MTDFSKLLKYATTDKQKAIVNAMAETDGKYRAAAKIAKTSHSYISELITEYKRLYAEENFQGLDESGEGLKIIVIPDTQVKPDDPIDHLIWAANYIVDKKPDVVVMIGDWWDMPSLSSYDKGKRKFEGRRYIRDIEAGNSAMDHFLEPIKAETARTGWNPRLVFTLGNHEERILRATNIESMLEGTIGYHDLNLGDWEVCDFLDPVIIGGVAFCHFFTSGTMGRPVSSARALLTRKMMSCIMGHVQDRDIAYGKRGDGKRVASIFVGIFYQHDEDYLGAQGNNSWRGIWMLNEVKDGCFDEMPISLNFLKQKYSKRAA